MIQTVAVIGAGTMGSGIALAAAIKQYPVILCDIQNEVLDRSKKSIDHNLQTLVEKQKISAAQKEAAWKNLTFTSSIKHCKAHLIIEAVVEKLNVKIDLFQQLALVNNAGTILASNTSSLSITAIQNALTHPSRVAGLHFFNPAHIMKLVEVVQAASTSDDTAQLLMQFCRSLDKMPVLCKDAPGFIVNRVARHYYLEAMHLVQSGAVTIEQADEALENAGFKMGPFKLMDLIGLDINLAVSQSLYEAFHHAPRFKPSALQIEKVKKNELGRKTGKGFYYYEKIAGQ